MSVSRMINSKFWSDSFVVDRLNPLDRYLFLYFLTNEKTNLAGVYEIPLRTIANETGLDKEEILRMLERLKGKIEYNDGWVCLINFVKHQNLNNKSIVKGIENELVDVPKNILIWVNKLRKETRGVRVVDERGTTTDNRIELNLIESKLNKENKKETKTEIQFFLFNKNTQKEENTLKFSTSQEANLWAARNQKRIGDDYFQLEVRETNKSYPLHHITYQS